MHLPFTQTTVYQCTEKIFQMKTFKKRKEKKQLSIEWQVFRDTENMENHKNY